MEVEAGLKPAPTRAFIFGGGQFFGHNFSAGIGTDETPAPPGSDDLS
jgi:hypothetical protein